MAVGGTNFQATSKVPGDRGSFAGCSLQGIPRAQWTPELIGLGVFGIGWGIGGGGEHITPWSIYITYMVHPIVL